MTNPPVSEEVKRAVEEAIKALEKVEDFDCEHPQCRGSIGTVRHSGWPILLALVQQVRRHPICEARIADLEASLARAGEIHTANVDVLVKQRDRWRHVVDYYLGDYSDTHEPEECRAEAIRRAVATGKQVAALEEENRRLSTWTDRVLAVCVLRGWSDDWPNRSSNLFLEAAELTEAVRGKRGDVTEEAANVLFTTLALAGSKGVHLPAILAALNEQIEALKTRPIYVGEHTTIRAVQAEDEKGSPEPDLLKALRASLDLRAAGELEAQRALIASKQAEDEKGAGE